MVRVICVGPLPGRERRLKAAKNRVAATNRRETPT